jgi:hypothetical protein
MFAVVFTMMTLSFIFLLGSYFQIPTKQKYILSRKFAHLKCKIKGKTELNLTNQDIYSRY